MARVTIWAAAFVLVGAWTLLALLGYGALDFLGTFAVERADTAATRPEDVAGIARLFALLRDLGLFAVIVLWFCVSAVILLIAAALARLVRA